MIIHHGEPCISCEHYSPDTREENHWVCDFDHDTCPHIEALHKAVGYKKRIDADVLDKIRAEIEEYKSRQLTLAIGIEDLEEGKQIAIEYVLGIIDKYKASPTGQKVRSKK